MKKHVNDCIKGLFISLFLTIIAYILAVKLIFPIFFIKILIILCAIIQIISQIIYFINIKEISKIDINLYIGSLIFTIFIIMIIIGGSLWIMYNINGK
ncbi:hypothetical protein [Candidatus Portiera aleyrodidarum]|uniref:Cytochrome o ubiquinol oxidase protein CyoD n=1 Tax=Candidatus Portiera aleyrodidarum TaxID=91844 RepID=A0A8D9JPV5_9GAMM|nr:hypothetical protein [Candidatus Portiera aleyrodidarum]CEI58719.1 Cytochrome o ubiquinol oxidase protein CyoD [Candidatus Portiera aleyrodidarum]